MSKANEIMALLRAKNEDGIDLSGCNFGITDLCDPIDNVSILEERGEEPVLMVYDGCGDAIPFEDMTLGEQNVIGNHIINLLKD